MCMQSVASTLNRMPDPWPLQKAPLVSAVKYGCHLENTRFISTSGSDSICVLMSQWIRRSHCRPKVAQNLIYFSCSYVTVFVITAWTTWNVIFSCHKCSDTGLILCNLTSVWTVLTGVWYWAHFENNKMNSETKWQYLQTEDTGLQCEDSRSVSDMDGRRIMEGTIIYEGVWLSGETFGGWSLMFTLSILSPLW